MKRDQKLEQIDYLKGVFNHVESVVLTSIAGMTVAQVTDLRRRLQESGVHLKVVKNTLAQKASAELPVAVLNDDFAGPTAMAWSTVDAVAPAKVLMKYAGENDKFKVRAGFYAGKRLSVEELKAMSTLPSMGELRAQLLGMIQSVPAKLLSQIQAPATHVVGVLAAHADKQKEAA